MTRRLAATLAALAVPLLFVAPVLAGGWAEVRPDAAATTETPPREGQPVEIGFTVLQHGETPAGWVTPTVHLLDVASGATLDVPASGQGPDGHFIATFTPPAAGFWSWTVSFPELAYDTIPVTLAIHAADGTAPAFVPQRDAIEGLQADVQALQAERAALTAQMAALTEGGPASPTAIVGIVLLATLAGGAAGFLMAWLGGRRGPRETDVALSPAPRGSTPA